MSAQLQAILAEADRWANETFPASNDHAKLTHLREEFAELLADPSSGEELADVLMLLSHLCGPAAIRTLVDAIALRGSQAVRREVTAKLAICRARTWGDPDADGVVHAVDRLY